jgi:COP9 signalosome complex subunit 6
LLVKEVHKQPQLDLVGWFTLGPASGPGPHILPIHRRITELYNDSAILLLFHPESTYTEATAAGKLPLTLYESLYENAPSDPNDKAMDIDGAVKDKAIKFRELVYSVETGEAEMISVDFVARGGGNATAVEGSVEASASAADGSKASESAGKKGKGKQKEKEKESEKDAPIDDAAVLDADDEESKYCGCRCELDYANILQSSRH